VVTLFLTMLVGAGGNAGNQSAIKVIRGLVSHYRTTPLLVGGVPGAGLACCGHVKLGTNSRRLRLVSPACATE
jgi:hypothetical protein